MIDAELYRHVCEQPWYRATSLYFLDGLPRGLVFAVTWNVRDKIAGNMLMIIGKEKITYD
jgi:hypothetical protein